MKKLLFIFFFSFLFIINAESENNISIEVKVNNEIITNLDIIDEINYLVALNNNLKNVEKKKLRLYAKNSLIREKIKKNELVKFFDLEKSSEMTKNIVNDFYLRLNFKSKEQFSNYLKQFNLEINDVEEKLQIEALWNQLVYNKFKTQLSIDKSSLKKKLKKQLNKDSNKINEYFLYEILFDLKTNENVEDKYNQILFSIENSGFENTANLFSISDTSKFGGKIGWVKETQLTNKINNSIKKLNTKNLTKPIQTENGYLILKLKDKREIIKKIDFDLELNNMISRERDKQLNQFSILYFNKIKQNIFLNE